MTVEHINPFENGVIHVADVLYDQLIEFDLLSFGQFGKIQIPHIGTVEECNEWNIEVVICLSPRSPSA